MVVGPARLQKNRRDRTARHGPLHDKSEDGQSHNALNNSFQDSGYGDSIEDSDHDHGIKGE